MFIHCVCRRSGSFSSLFDNDGMVNMPLCSVFVFDLWLDNDGCALLASILVAAMISRKDFLQCFFLTMALPCLLFVKADPQINSALRPFFF